jgi:hypothetical protein
MRKFILSFQRQGEAGRWKEVHQLVISALEDPRELKQWLNLGQKEKWRVEVKEVTYVGKP